MKILEYKSYILGFAGVDDEKGAGIFCFSAPFSASFCGALSDPIPYYEKEEGFNKFLKDFPFFSRVKWYLDNSTGGGQRFEAVEVEPVDVERPAEVRTIGGSGSFSGGVIELDTKERIDYIFVFPANLGFIRVVLNGVAFDFRKSLTGFKVFSYGENVGGLFACGALILFPAEVFGKVYTLTTKVLEESLRTVLDEKNTDLVLLKRDCPYIPLKSLNGSGGAIYQDGEYITLPKLGKTFKVLGSFHFVKDTDLNLAVAYVLGEEKPSLVVPQLLLDTFKGG